MPRHFLLIGTLGVALAAALGGWAASSSGSSADTEIRTTQRENAMNRFDASALAFLRGAWRMTREDGSVCEETWSGLDKTGDDASVMGMFRWVRSPEQGGTSKLGEFMTIREEQGTLVYRLRHFGVDLKPWEETPVVLHVTEAGDNRILMQPPEDGGSVVSIEYRLKDNTLICDAVFNHDGERDELGFVFEQID
ncbi:MAG: hypothetical protein ACI89L_000957 [Phycisphaerales bacterium]|jgi:hypothetical protein